MSKTIEDPVTLLIYELLLNHVLSHTIESIMEDIERNRIRRCQDDFLSNKAQEFRIRLKLLEEELLPTVDAEDPIYQDFVKSLEGVVEDISEQVLEDSKENKGGK